MLFRSYSLVESARRILNENADRCYRVEMDAPTGWPFVPMDDSTLVWTRGDRFLVEMQREGKPFVWGQDEAGRFWMVYSSECGLLFEKRELPPSIARSLAYLSLDVKKLTGALLEDCDLQYPAGAPPRFSRTATVAATFKHGRKSYQFEAATLDIDLRTKVIRRLELRLQSGAGDGRLQLTLVDDAPRSDDAYRLKSHLAPDARILGRNQRAERQRLTLQLITQRRTKRPGGQSPAASESRASRTVP